ncbi:Zn(2)-C6 fungal-type domain-containing protein [Mycena chlorophos]|uniref:Zn(2)-C6 fungal-type domain-containing protein n=1 Tax=Mycena chlorophos TaxID=658473 RepID=A0A8H6TAY7_MYCCL|nr:Zn(2)-C6 fungal-type domain-containing protein [Mycena chlorophos]
MTSSSMDPSGALLSVLFPNAPRSRVPVACVRCRRRKIKCKISNDAQSCERCTKKGFQCEYIPVNDPRNAVPPISTSAAAAAATPGMRSASPASASSPESLSPLIPATGGRSSPSASKRSKAAAAQTSAPHSSGTLLWLEPVVEGDPTQAQRKQQVPPATPRRAPTPSTSTLSYFNSGAGPGPTASVSPRNHSPSAGIDRPQALRVEAHPTAMDVDAGQDTHHSSPTSVDFDSMDRFLEDNLRSLVPDRWPPLPDTEWVSRWRSGQTRTVTQKDHPGINIALGVGVDPAHAHRAQISWP